MSTRDLDRARLRRAGRGVVPLALLALVAPLGGLAGHADAAGATTRGAVRDGPPAPVAHPFRVAFGDDFSTLDAWDVETAAGPGVDAADVAWHIEDGERPGRTPLTSAVAPRQVGAPACEPGHPDASSLTSMTSPAVAIPGDAHLPRVQLTANVNGPTFFEDGPGGADGGNLSISVDGGPFELPPEDAWTVRWTTGHGGEIGFEDLDDPTRTNPLDGQRVIRNAHDLSSPELDLERAGIEPGDRVRVRLSWGRNGCEGQDRQQAGWVLRSLRVVDGQEPFRLRTWLERPRTWRPPAVLRWGDDIVVATEADRTGDPSLEPEPSGLVRLVGTHGDTLDHRRGTGYLRLDTERLPPGRHELSVAYDGDERQAPVPGTQTIALRLRPAIGEVHGRFKPRGRPTARRRFAMDVDTGEARGIVRVFFRGRQIGATRLWTWPTTGRAGHGVVRTWRGVPPGARRLRMTWTGAPHHTDADAFVYTRFVRS